MVRKWEAMYYLRKVRDFSIFALIVVMPSLASANSVLTSQTYVDAKVQAQGSTVGSILNSQSPDDKAPSSKAVYTALQSAVSGIDGTPYQEGTGIDINDHTISNTGVLGVSATVSSGTDGTITVTQLDSTGVSRNTEVAVKGLGSAAYKTVETAISTTAANNTDNELATAKAVYDYVGSATATGNFVENAINSTVTNKAPAEQAVYNALADKQDIQIGAAGDAGKVLVVDSTGKISMSSATGATTYQPYTADANKISGANGSWKALDTQVNATTAAGGGAPTTGAVKTYADAKVSSTASVSSTSTTTAPNEQAVYNVVNNKQVKPSSGVANGKVLTYTGTDVDTQVSAAYVTIPVSSGAPSANTPSSFAEVWVQ